MGFINSRQYLDLAHREGLRHNGLIDITSFRDHSDRTLTINRVELLRGAVADSKERFRHIFILDKLLHIHVYDVDENGKATSITWEASEFLDSRKVSHETRRGASVTDFEFARIMEDLNRPLSFYAPGNSYGEHEEVSKNFFGLTQSTLAPKPF